MEMKPKKKIQFLLPDEKSIDSYTETEDSYTSKNTFVANNNSDRHRDQLYDKSIHVILLGNQYVGKSAFLFKYTTEYFCHPYLPTIGYDFKVSYLRTCETKEKVRLRIWDTSGSATNREEMAAKLFGYASAFIVMYDVTDIESYNDVFHWMELVKRYGIDNRQITIVGNKVDLVDERQITKEEGMKMADCYDAKFMEMSVRRNHNIINTMRRVVSNVCQANKERH